MSSCARRGAHDGYVFQIIGDAFCAAFHTANEALSAALDAQRTLQTENWGETPIKVRMGINTGAARAGTSGDVSGGYTGYSTMARTQRVMSTAHGEQILVSNTSADLLLGELPAGVSLHDMKEHRLKGLLNPEHLWQAVSANVRQDFPPLESLNAIPNNLPVQLTSFIGRETEITELRQLLQAHRLVTLTGSGGTGKTRVSLQVAAEVLDTFKDGAWFIELASLSDPALVQQAVSSALGVREEPGRPLMAVLMEWLAGREMLLVLDNCEHLVEACAKFADALLHVSGRSRILATSLEALGIAGEQAFRVPSLAAPDPAQASQIPVEELLQYPAVRLFVERATQALATFAVTKTTAPLVAQICNRLDGIPLAIELAAARVRVLHVEQIAERLDDRFQLLTGGSRSALPRQQTLRSLIDWSHSLLAEPEQVLLRRLSVFAGGWTLEAAESVCAGGDLQSGQVLDLLTHLVDKSLLVVAEGAGASRYHLLETIRQYAWQKLLASGESELLRDRQLSFFVELAERAEPEVRGHNQVLWLDRLEVDVDNLRLALTRAEERGAESFLRLASALWRFWDLRGHANEGSGWLTRALNATEGMRTDMRARALGRAGYVANNLQDAKHAAQLAQEAFGLSQELDDKPALAMAFFVQGWSALKVNQSDAGRMFLEQALSLFTEMGDHGLAGSTLTHLGSEAANRNELNTARSLMELGLQEVRLSGDQRRITFGLDWLAEITLAEGDAARAGELWEEELALARQMGDKGNFCAITISLGHVAVYLEDYAHAGQLLAEAARLCQERGDRVDMAIVRMELARLAWAQGELARSAEDLEEALAIGRQLDQDALKGYALYYLGQAARLQKDWKPAQERFSEALSLFRVSERGGYCLCLDGFGALALEKGQAGRAARLFGARGKLRDSAWARDNYPFMVRDRQKVVAQARAQLGEEAFNAAWDAGQEMSEEEMLAYALEKSGISGRGEP